MEEAAADKGGTSLNGFSPVSSAPVFWKSRKRFAGASFTVFMMFGCTNRTNFTFLTASPLCFFNVERQNDMLQNQIGMLMDMLQENEAVDDEGNQGD